MRVWRPNWKKIRRRWRWLAVIAIVLVAIRAALPIAVKSYVNRTLDKLPDYDGRVGDVDLNLLRGAYEIENVEIVKTTGRVPVPFFSSPKVDFSMQWSELLHGELVGEIDVLQPSINFVAGPTKEESQTGIHQDWTKRVEELFPFKINRFQIRHGRVHFRDFHRTPKVNVFITDLYVNATNLTNSRKIAKDLVAAVEARGAVLNGGKLRARIDIDPFATEPTFNLDAAVTDVNLTEINDLLLAYAKVDAESGTFHLYTELAAEQGYFSGYIKPMFDDLAIFSWKENLKNPAKLFWEAIVGTVSEVLENQPRGRLAARAPLSGRLDDPNVGLWSTIGTLLQNAFIRALLPGVEGSVTFDDVVTEKQFKSSSRD